MPRYYYNKDSGRVELMPPRVRNESGPYIIVKGGTPKSHTNKAAEKKAKWQDERSEQVHQDKQEDADLARIDKELERDYIGAELSYKHGHGGFIEERQMVQREEAKGISHGPKEVE